MPKHITETVPANITTTHAYGSGGMITLTDDPSAGNEIGDRDYNDARYASSGGVSGTVEDRAYYFAIAV